MVCKLFSARFWLLYLFLSALCLVAVLAVAVLLPRRHL